MFEQYNVHNCNKIDDMKNISSICSCDLSRKEKARPRKTFLDKKGIISRLQSKCNGSLIFINRNKGFDCPLDSNYDNKCNHGWAYFSNSALQDKCNQQTSSQPYPRWFERTVRYLFSKQLRKCFDLA